MKRLALFIIVFIIINITAQSQITSLVNNQDFKWGAWESIRFPKQKLQYLTDSISGLDSISVINNLHKYKVVDISGNGTLDVIYKGFDGSGAFQTTLYLNINGDFKKIIDLNEEIINISRSKPWMPIEFQTTEPYHDDHRLIRSYHSGLLNGRLTYVLENTLSMHNDLKLIIENIPPLQFLIMKVPQLHWTPNSTTDNIIKLYKKGVRGYAVASTSDVTARSWWLVLIKEGEYLYQVGWMLRQNLKPLTAKNIN